MNSAGSSLVFRNLALQDDDDGVGGISIKGTNSSQENNMLKKLKAGTIWVNTYRAISFISRFGGYKRSGKGRESGQESIKEFLQVKSVWIAQKTTPANPFIMR